MNCLKKCFLRELSLILFKASRARDSFLLHFVYLNKNSKWGHVENGQDVFLKRYFK